MLAEQPTPERIDVEPVNSPKQRQPLYAARNWKGMPSPREGQELAWVRPNRLSEYPMPPADVPLVAMLRDLL